MPGLTKQRLVELAEEKLSSAKALASTGHFTDAYYLSGYAIYLSGYAIELLLKAIVAKQFQAETIPDKQLVSKIHTHDLAALVKLAELQDSLAALQKDDPDFSGLWQIAIAWSEQVRYGNRTAEEAHELIEALSDPNRGVVKWLRQHL